MKLIRFGEPNKEFPGILLEDAERLDVSAYTRNYDETFFADGGLPGPRGMAVEKRIVTTSRPSFGSPRTPHRPTQQDRVYRPELPRSRQRKRYGDPERAGDLF